nr:MAG TPA: ChiA1-BD-binding domain protein [Caudoviricetes sp.]
MTKTVIRFFNKGGIVYNDMPEEFKIEGYYTDIPPLKDVPLERQSFVPDLNEWIDLGATGGDEESGMSEDVKAIVIYAIQTANLSDDQALTVADFYDEWKSATEYKAETIIKYENELYRVVQDHTAQEDWLPNKAVSLYSLIKINDGGIEEWTQPTGGHDAYKKGGIVQHNDHIWESLVDGNVWEPVEGTLWKEVSK